MQIIMKPERYFYDEIEKGEPSTLLKYHKALKGSVKTWVMSGSVKITVGDDGFEHTEQHVFTNDNSYHDIAYDFVDKGAN